MVGYSLDSQEIGIADRGSETTLDPPDCSPRDCRVSRSREPPAATPPQGRRNLPSRWASCPPMGNPRSPRYRVGTGILDSDNRQHGCPVQAAKETNSCDYL